LDAGDNPMSQKNYIAIVSYDSKNSFFTGSYFRDYKFLRGLLLGKGYKILAEKAGVNDVKLSDIIKPGRRVLCKLERLARRAAKSSNIQRELDNLCS
jgi:hypothetical protein